MNWYKLCGQRIDTRILFTDGIVIGYEVGPVSYAFWPTADTVEIVRAQINRKERIRLGC